MSLYVVYGKQGCGKTDFILNWVSEKPRKRWFAASGSSRKAVELLLEHGFDVVFERGGHEDTPVIRECSLWAAFGKRGTLT